MECLLILIFLLLAPRNFPEVRNNHFVWQPGYPPLRQSPRLHPPTTHTGDLWLVTCQLKWGYERWKCWRPVNNPEVKILQQYLIILLDIHRYKIQAIVQQYPHHMPTQSRENAGSGTIKYCEKAAFCRVVVMMVRCDCTLYSSIVSTSTHCTRNLQEGWCDICRMQSSHNIILHLHFLHSGSFDLCSKEM